VCVRACVCVSLNVLNNCPVTGSYEHAVLPSGSTKSGQFLYQPLDYLLLENDCTPCSAFHKAKLTTDACCVQN
jgi:hypothetical protein